jgi:hypothetical protein
MTASSATGGSGVVAQPPASIAASDVAATPIHFHRFMVLSIRFD